MKSASLKITADSRYEVWLDGQWIGHGPVRSWLEPWSVDRYDLAVYMKPGRHILAIMVHHLGLSTFQYLYSMPGLLVDLGWKEGRRKRSVVSDESWRCTIHSGFNVDVPRVSVQQGWEEQFDAGRVDVVDWRIPAFDARRWKRARIVPSSHKRLVARDIPFLTRSPVLPVQIVDAEIVRPAPLTLSFNLRWLVSRKDVSANICRSRILAVTHIYSPVSQKVQLHNPSQWFQPVKLNGVELKFDDMSLHLTQGGVAHARLHKGWNVLMVRAFELSHVTEFSLNVWTGRPVRCCARPDQADHDSVVWLALGPFAGETGRGGLGGWFGEYMDNNVCPDRIVKSATEKRFYDLWATGLPDDDALHAPYASVLLGSDSPALNVYAQCASERINKKTTAHVENTESLICGGEGWIVIKQPRKGDSVRLLLDFGREVIGFHAFEIDAPAGTIVDNHNFEFIQKDGRHNLCEGMSNCFRYTCRDGVQEYRSFLRRGFRYSWFSFRNFRRPIRLRYIRVLESHYPALQAGSFECSDRMLTRIWEVGAQTVRCCSEDTYTDCPSYEQTHWVGDARNEALVDLVVNGDGRLSRHSWLQAAQSLERSPLVEALVPSGWQVVIPAWTFLWMRWAGEHFQLTGDRRFAKESLKWLARNVDGLRECVNSYGLIDVTAWNLFDWAAMDTPPAGVVTHQNCLAVLALKETAALAEQMGQKSLSAGWIKLAVEIAYGVNAHLWDKAKQAYSDCLYPDGEMSKVFSQQTQTVAYISGVASGKRAKRCREVMIKPPAGFVSAGSPFFMCFVLEALDREGASEELQRRIKEYWAPQIKAGATTFWEMYHPKAARLTRSHCHGWSAASTYYLTRHVLGVQPLDPGYRRVLISPGVGMLKWAGGKVPTPNGVIECKWKRRNKDILVQVSAPAGTEVLIQTAQGRVVCTNPCSAVIGLKAEKRKFK